MANRLLAREEIEQQIRKLSAGQYQYTVLNTAIVRSDGAQVNYCTADLLMSAAEFADRVIVPLMGIAPVIKTTAGLLDQRGATHGDYTEMCAVIQKIKGVMGSGTAWAQCSPTQRESLELIATKIGRIVCGDPNYHDHWDDIAGYATKARERIGHKHA